MEEGSIEEVFERLKSWCLRNDPCLARVEWDSVYTRQDVVDRLKRSLSSVGTTFVEIGLPPGEAADKTVTGLLEKLRSVSGSVVSITGVEWAFPEHGNRLDTLVALSFKREILAALPVHQIWWVPSSLTERFILGVPDLDSWFRLRLHLTEVPPRPADAVREVSGTEGRTVSVAEARSIARRFWERLDRARAQNLPEERIWRELAQPAVDALVSAGLALEADAILARMSDARGAIERELQELMAAHGPEDAEVLSVTGRLARLLRDQGDLAGARRLQERELEISRIRAQGDLDGARRLQERLLEIRRRVLGEEHPNTLMSMNNLSVTLSQAGDPEGALRLLRKCLTGRRKVLGENHPDTVATAELLTRLEEQPQASRPGG